MREPPVWELTEQENGRGHPLKTCDEKGRSILSEPASLQESETERTHWIEFVEKITTSIIILTTKDRPPWKTFDCERRGLKLRDPV